MTFELTVIGERPSDSTFLTTVLERLGGGGELVGHSDHPLVGNFGVCEFWFEFPTSGSRESFLRVVGSLGFN